MKVFEIVIISLLYVLIGLVPYMIYLVSKYKRDLHVLQMNSYRNKRYFKWLKEHLKETFKFKDLLPLIILFFIEIFFNKPFFIFMIWNLIFICLICYRTKYKEKKPLVFTKRAKRIFITTCIITLLGVVGLIYNSIDISFENIKDFKYSILFDININKKLMILNILILTLTNIFSFIVVLISNIILVPIEKSIQKGFYNKAKKKLKSINGLKIIGITGSYGKTSTKMIVSGILEEKYNLCKTPGSYNTLMGVVRTINEYLKKTDKIFIVEMGAKQRGDIKEICDLVKPDMGIITSIGPQHLETFKSIENVVRTKWELIDSLDKDDIAILNLDNEYINKEYVKLIKKDNVDIITYSLDKDKGMYYAKDIEITDEGTLFTVVNGEEEVQLKTKLLGNHNIYNILAAVSVARKLGMTFKDIKKAVIKIKPVEHRLELKKTKIGITILDDAFNSNPSGSKMALDVLKTMKGNKKIVITPGMVELGSKQYELNKQLGRYCAESCDYVILVGKIQTKPLQDGLEEENYPKEKIYIAKDLDDANNKMKQIIEKNDIVLYENDLLEDR